VGPEAALTAFYHLYRHLKGGETKGRGGERKGLKSYTRGADACCRVGWVESLFLTGHGGGFGREEGYLGSRRRVNSEKGPGAVPKNSATVVKGRRLIKSRVPNKLEALEGRLRDS